MNNFETLFSNFNSIYGFEEKVWLIIAWGIALFIGGWLLKFAIKNAPTKEEWEERKHYHNRVRG